MLSNQWHHVVGDGSMATVKQIWVDGGEVATWKYRVPYVPGAAALRIGAAGEAGIAGDFLDADLAMPAIYGKALSPAEIEARVSRESLVPSDRSGRAGMLAAR